MESTFQQHAIEEPAEVLVGEDGREQRAEIAGSSGAAMWGAAA